MLMTAILAVKVRYGSTAAMHQALLQIPEACFLLRGYKHPYIWSMQLGQTDMRTFYECWLSSTSDQALLCLVLTAGHFAERLQGNVAGAVEAAAHAHSA